MSNMSYCRFQNTLSDLRDCYNNWDNIEIEYDDNDEEIDSKESKARKAIYELCEKIVNNCGI